MRGSSLLVLALLCGFGQDGSSDAELKKRLKDLAAEGSASAEALKFLDGLPVARLETLHRLALTESREVRSACRSLLPPASWSLSEEKSIGDVRARLHRYAAVLATADPESQDKRWEAIRQLTLRGNADAGAAVLKVYRENPTFSYISGVLAILGSPDQTPVLLEILEASGRGFYGVSEVLNAVGDSRAEKAILKRLESDGENRGMWFKPLSNVGGELALEALRKEAADPAAPAWLWNYATQGRMNLRDPRLPADLVAVSGRDRHVFKSVYRGLARMGDRSVVPELAKRLEDPNARPEDRLAALQVIALLGTREQVPVVVKCLEEKALAATAADALAEFGDPSAAAALAVALKHDQVGKAFARALMHIPPEGVESHVMEVLDDPAGHRMSFIHAVAVAGRLKSDRVRKRLVALLMDLEPRLYDGFEVARAVVPMLGKGDLRQLSRSSSPDAPHEDAKVKYPRLAARAALGDENARRDFVRAAINGGLPLWWEEDRRNQLLKYPGPPLDLLPYVKAELKANPAQAHGVEYMLRLRPDEAWPYVENAIKGQAGHGLLGELATLMKGEQPKPGWVRTLESYDDEVL
ncbi:MAG TPA: hypothetical protein VJU16_02345, partial [Planctomycetota bacterium]|nr:hypothetical protein [Planctomycetota bacterium]